MSETKWFGFNRIFPYKHDNCRGTGYALLLSQIASDGFQNVPFCRAELVLQGHTLLAGCYRRERDIWKVVHVTEEDFETTEGEQEHLYDKLMEMTGWTVTDKEKEHLFSKG